MSKNEVAKTQNLFQDMTGNKKYKRN